MIDLYSHMHWADAAAWGTLLSSDPAREDEHIRSLAYHVHLVQHAFLHVWKKEKYDVPKADSFSSMEELAAWGRRFHAEVPDFLSALTGDELAAEIDVPWSFQIKRMFGVEPAVVTLHDTMQQVVMHSQYHRAQLNTMLRALGGTPAHGDLISWIWLGRPQPAWPEI
jgi:uncharacterized damage-inducible protein DinB